MQLKQQGKFFGKRVNIIVSLDTIFLQQGNDLKQSYFHNLLTKMRNAKSFLDDLDILMSRVDMSFPFVENILFHSSIHLFHPSCIPFLFSG